MVVKLILSFLLCSILFGNVMSQTICPKNCLNCSNSTTCTDCNAEYYVDLLTKTCLPCNLGCQLC